MEIASYKSDSEASSSSNLQSSLTPNNIEASTRDTTPSGSVPLDKIGNMDTSSLDSATPVKVEKPVLHENSSKEKKSAKSTGARDLVNLLNSLSYDPACEYSLPSSYLRRSKSRKVDDYEMELLLEKERLAEKRKQKKASVTKKTNLALEQSHQDKAQTDAQTEIKPKRAYKKRKTFTKSVELNLEKEYSEDKLSLDDIKEERIEHESTTTSTVVDNKSFGEKSQLEAQADVSSETLSLPDSKSTDYFVGSSLPMHVLPEGFWLSSGDILSEGFDQLLQSYKVSNLPEEFIEVELIVSPVQPAYKERFQINTSAKRDSVVFYNPMLEIGNLIHYSTLIYFPAEHRDILLHQVVEPLYEAFSTGATEQFVAKVVEYNAYIEGMDVEVLRAHVHSVREVPLNWIHFLLSMVYSRGVIPDAKKLKNYKAFSNFVYGELMPSLLSKTYKQCGMNNSSVFVDLGSGVGNCVIQAALEYNCQLSYGIEIMETPSDLTEIQCFQLKHYTRLFGVRLGELDFSLKESFVNNPKTIAYLKKCDILLVNNFIFDAALSLEIEKLIQNCKIGCKIISLKSLRPTSYVVGSDHELNNIISRLKINKYTLPTDSVSWTHRGCGDYFISEVTDTIDENLFSFSVKTRTRGNNNIDYNVRRTYANMR